MEKMDVNMITEEMTMGVDRTMTGTGTAETTETMDGKTTHLDLQ